MRNKLYVGMISALGVFFLFGSVAFAKTKQIDVIFPSEVGNSLKLKPGEYRINVAQNMKNPEVKFYTRYGHYVGEAPVKVVNESQKNHHTQIDYNKQASNQEALTKISPRGWSENLIFSHSKASPSTAKD